MKRTAILAMVGGLLIGAAAPAVAAPAMFSSLEARAVQPQDPPDRHPLPREPVISVGGRGEMSVRPDRATVVLGAVAQSEQASEAQGQVNAIMQRAFEQIRTLNIPEEAISTVGLTLEPVYSQPPRQRPQEMEWEPRIVGFRARNSIQIRVDDLSLIGRVLDLGIEAGANQIQGVNFELQDDRRVRAEALRRATQDARQKAQTIAEALELRLGEVLEVAEADIGFEPPRPMYAGAEMRMAMDAGTPVHAGQIKIDARVVVRYRIGGRPD